MRYTKLDRCYDSKSGNIFIPNGKNKLNIIIGLTKEKIERLMSNGVNNNGNNRRKKISEVLMKSKFSTKSILEYARNYYGTTKFDFELLLGLCDKIKNEKLNKKSTKKNVGQTFSINFHLDTLLDRRFFDLLNGVKSMSGIYKLNFLKIEILEEKGKKILSEPNLERLGYVIRRLQNEGIQIGLDDFGIGCNNIDFLGKILKTGAKLNFIKIDGGELIRFFTGKNIKGDSTTSEELKNKIIANIIEIRTLCGEKVNDDGKLISREGKIRRPIYFVLEGVTNIDALKWAEQNLEGYVDYLQGYAIGKKIEIHKKQK